ncbi:MAG TPA: LysR substrate-binding domain-containing protein [Bryobacteraceae bacterium]|nr:LysR substrate-binding domain-containing protein [Bryobacteraceae bacterium]
MDLRHLRYFCAVAEYQGFSRSARALHVSQSAISEQISDLERELGVALLVRGRQKTQLTLQGEVFVQEAKKLLAAADHAVETVRRSARGEIGTLNIGFFNGGTGPDVPSIIKDFRRLHPGVRVGVVDILPGLQSNALTDGTLDVGFTRPLETPFDQLLRSELLYLDPLVAVFPKDHPCAPGPVNLKTLSRERFVLVARESSPSLFGRILALCSEAGFSPHIVSTGAAWASVALLVEAGEGIAILPSNLQHGASRNLAFCRLTNPRATIGLVMAWSRQREGPVLHSFLSLVRGYKSWPRIDGGAGRPKK